ncbi:hypothetical protein LXA43DRAFT_1030195 [Ganoderma leucocontextum]|nr:hypothetical protein LXA43DRAFT_1030195 [Ganoderma leucocontextum]
MSYVTTGSLDYPKFDLLFLPRRRSRLLQGGCGTGASSVDNEHLGHLQFAVVTVGGDDCAHHDGQMRRRDVIVTECFLDVRPVICHEHDDYGRINRNGRHEIPIHEDREEVQEVGSLDFPRRLHPPARALESLVFADLEGHDDRPYGAIRGAGLDEESEQLLHLKGPRPRDEVSLEPSPRLPCLVSNEKRRQKIRTERQHALGGGPERSALEPWSRP